MAPTVAQRRRQRRTDLLAVLATMPEEAFSWIVGALLQSPARAGYSQIYPDGLGGFLPESRTAIVAAQRAAQAYAETHDAV